MVLRWEGFTGGGVLNEKAESKNSRGDLQAVEALARQLQAVGRHGQARDTLRQRLRAEPFLAQHYLNDRQVLSPPGRGGGGAQAVDFAAPAGGAAGVLVVDGHQ